MGGYHSLPELQIPQAPDVLGQAGKVLQLKSLLQNQQYQQQAQPLELQQRQQAVQQGQMANEQAQLDLHDQQAFRQAFQQSQGDPDKTLAAAAQLGVGPKVLTPYADAVLKRKSDLLSYNEKQLNFESSKNDVLTGHVNAILAAPDAQVHDALANTVQQSVQQGLIQPQDAQSLSQMTQLPPDQIRQQLNLFKLHLQGDKSQIEDAFKGSEVSKNTAQAGEANAQTQKINAEVQGSTGPLAESKYRRILSDLSAGTKVSDADLQFARGFELSGRKTTTASDTLGVTSTNTSGPSGLAALRRQGAPLSNAAPAAQAPLSNAAPAAQAPLSNAAPAAQAPLSNAAPAAIGNPAANGTSIAAPQNSRDAIVDMVGQYKLNPTMLQRLIVKHPDVLAAVSQKYPDFDQTVYNAKNKILSSYTSGPESKPINAINVAIGHAGELGTAIDGLKNDNLPLLNGLANKYNVATGGTPVTTFKLIVHRLAPEIAAAYIQGGGGEGERGTNAADFDPGMGAAQLRSNLAETIKLLRSKIGAQEQQWNSTFQPKRPEDQFQNRFLTPQARQTIQQYGSGATSGAQPGAKKQAYLQDGKWFDAQTHQAIQ